MGVPNHAKSPLKHITPKSNHLVELFLTDFAVAEDLRKETATDGLATMHGDNSAAPVRVAKESMTSLGTDDLKAEFAEGMNEFHTGEGGKATHVVTAIRCTPTNSLVTGSSTSRQSSTASFTR